MKPRVEESARLLLVTQRLNKYELADAASCDQRTAQRVLKLLHQKRYVRICGWDVCYRAPIPIYAIGAGKDAYRPKPIDKNAVQRRRRKDLEVRWEEALIKRKKRSLEKIQKAFSS
jgi:hypothetical protein